MTWPKNSASATAAWPLPVATIERAFVVRRLRRDEREERARIVRPKLRVVAGLLREVVFEAHGVTLRLALPRTIAAAVTCSTRAYISK